MIVHLVTDRRRLARVVPDWRTGLVDQARAAAAADVDVVQVREPGLEAHDLCDLVRGVVAACDGTRTRVVVNDRVDVAIAAGAAGVHLPARGLPAALVRAIAPSGFLIGRSVHGVEEMEGARGADYLIAGTVWPSASKPDGHPQLGLAGLQAIAARAEVPVVAIGGVTLERAASVLEFGARGVAAIGLFIDAVTDLHGHTRSLGAIVAALRNRSR